MYIKVKIRNKFTGVIGGVISWVSPVLWSLSSVTTTGGIQFIYYTILWNLIEYVRTAQLQARGPIFSDDPGLSLAFSCRG